MSEDHIVHLQFIVVELAKKQTSVEAGGKRRNQLAEISDYVVNKKEIEYNSLDPIGSPIREDKQPVPIGSHT
jgi:hypothetical protein